MKSFLAIIRQYKGAMAMNFVGLVLAFTAFICLVIQVEYQLNFDKHYSTAGRIFRVDKVGVAKDDIFRNILPRGYADDILRSSSHIVAGSIVSPYIGELVLRTDKKEGGHIFKYSCNIAYPALFEIFGVKFKEGQAQELLDWQKIAIPHSLAKKLYGEESAIGKVLYHKEQYKIGAFRESALVVGAVYEDLPDNSQFSNDIYMHVGNIQEGSYGGANCVCWILLDSPESKELVEDNFNSNHNYGDDTWLTDMELTPIEDIYFGENEGDVYKSGSFNQMWLMLCISVLIVLIGGINYATFFTALSPIRVKTINTQKVLGSSLGALRMSLMLEAVLFCICAFIFALCIVTPITQWIMSHGLISTIFNFWLNWRVVLLSAGISLLIGIVAGLYPSFYVTSLPAAFALKGNFGFSAGGRRFRTGMLLFQYVISFILFVLMIFISRQNNFMMDFDSGFDKEQVAVVKLSQSHVLNKSEWLKEQLSLLAEVEDVAFSMELMGGGDEYSIATVKYDGKDVQFYTLYCSANFLDVMGIEVADGRNFENSDFGALIINQKMKELGAKVGEKTDAGGIIGQAAQVRINSLRKAEAPFCYVLLPKEYGLMQWAYIRLHKECDKKIAVEKINSVLQQMDPNHLFEVKLYDRITSDLYAKESRQSKIIMLFSLLACMLSLIGIFGQALLDVQYSRRDIAVKKVYGADTFTVLGEGLKKYILIVTFSFAVAAPVAWFIVGRWLEEFTEKAPLTIWPYVGAFVVILALTISIVALQYIKASNMNPARTLKAE